MHFLINFLYAFLSKLSRRRKTKYFISQSVRSDMNKKFIPHYITQRNAELLSPLQLSLAWRHVCQGNGCNNNTAVSLNFLMGIKNSRARIMFTYCTFSSIQLNASFILFHFFPFFFYIRSHYLSCISQTKTWEDMQWKNILEWNGFLFLRGLCKSFRLCNNAFPFLSLLQFKWRKLCGLKPSAVMLVVIPMWTWIAWDACFWLRLGGESLYPS